MEIINRVAQWSGSDERAFAWFRSQPLPSFGDKTAEDLVKEGRTDAVKAYLSRIAGGGYDMGLMEIAVPDSGRVRGQTIGANDGPRPYAV